MTYLRAECVEILARWAADEITRLVRTDFARFEGDRRIAVRACIEECRSWAVRPPSFAVVVDDESLTELRAHQKHIAIGLRAHSSAFLREVSGFGPGTTESENSWVKATFERMYSYSVAELTKNADGLKHRLGRKEFCGFITAADERWKYSSSHSDESSWVFERKDNSGGNYRLSFILAGGGKWFGYRLGLPTGASEFPITYDRLVGFAGFVFRRCELTQVAPMVRSILNESQRVIDGLTGC